MQSSTMTSLKFPKSTFAIKQFVFPFKNYVRTVTSLGRTNGRIVILGSGWGGFKVMKMLDQKHYDVVVVSPRNYFVFTPLLAGTSVGTLEFRCVTEPIRYHAKDIRFYQAECEQIDFSKKEIMCRGVLDDNAQKFPLTYDKLIISCGGISRTFNIPGVKQYAFFLKDVSDAKRIRSRVLECFEWAMQPDRKPEDILGRLHFAVVGGGPTGVEFAAELHDFITQDLARLYPSLMDKVRMTVYDVAGKILSSFDSRLSEYTTQRFSRGGISIKTGVHVTEVKQHSLIINKKEEVPFGLLVWATGIGPTSLIQSLALPQDKARRLMTDDHLRVIGQDEKPIENVFALGDCATIKGYDLPSTAQVAQQKAKYLAKALNKEVKGKAIEKQPKFEYFHYGSMAYVGDWRAVIDRTKIQGESASKSGLASWLLWRSAYFTMTVSWKNKIMIPMYWFLTWIFGRDISKL